MLSPQNFFSGENFLNSVWRFLFEKGGGGGKEGGGGGGGREKGHSPPSLLGSLSLAFKESYGTLPPHANIKGELLSGAF